MVKENEIQYLIGEGHNQTKRARKEGYHSPYPKEGAPWEEPNDLEDKLRQLYKIIQSNLDSVKPNDQGELDIGSTTSVRRNSDADLYDWQLEKYKSYVKD